MNYRHLILTRSDYKPGHRHIPYRAELFRRYTLPSVLHQTSRNFTWVVQTRNPEFRDLCMESGIATAPSGEWPTFHVEQPWLVTTRLDNDDALMPDFVEQIQAALRPAVEVIDAPGYRVNTVDGEVVRCDRYGRVPSPFATLVERAKDARGIYQAQHTRLGALFPVRRLESRLWVQVIHERNSQMRWLGGDPATPAEAERVRKSWLR